MNLDDFKTQINKKLETDISFEMPIHRISTRNFSANNSVFYKIQRSLKFEIFCGILFVIFFSFISYTSNSLSLKAYFTVFSILIFAFTSILYYLYQKTKKTSSAQLNIKQHLVSLHSLLSNFVRRCFQFTMLLIPICFVCAILLAYNEIQYTSNDGSVNFDVPIPTKYLIIILFIVIMFSVLVYYFTKWYLNKLYGDNLKELKELIDELS